MERRRPQVLVVEDDDDLRGLVGDLLEDEEFAVIEAGNGQAALDYLLAAPATPSLILLDLNMPVMTGRQLIAALRGDARLAAIPILVVTSEPPTQDPPEPGTVGRLQKPYSAGHLLKLVREHAAPARDDADTGGATGKPRAHRPRLVD